MEGQSASSRHYARDPNHTRPTHTTVLATTIAEAIPVVLGAVNVTKLGRSINMQTELVALLTIWICLT
jgi:hypothetical protein